MSPVRVTVVCPGTQNRLSSTGSQENQYNMIKERYEGCEIIMGNLEITHIESNWDFSFLKVSTSQPHSSTLVVWMMKSLVFVCLFSFTTVLCSYFQTIREVTGYILIFMNHLQEIPLGKLRIIRGNSLYEKSFALSVIFNYPKDGSNGLRQLGLGNLTGRRVEEENLEICSNFCLNGKNRKSM